MLAARVFRIAGLALLAAWLVAPPAVAQFNIFQPLFPQPANPTPAPAPAPKPPAQQKKPTPAATQAKPAAVPLPTPPPAAAQKKPDGKTLDAKKLDKKDNKKPEPAKHALADYYRVWGIGAETTRKDIVARFGEPQRIGDSERKPFYYFNDTLTFYFTAEDTVGTMIIGNSFSAIPKDAIPPDVVDKAFIGRKRDDVLKTFGPAQVVSSENYRYFPKTGSYKVEFQCYDFKGYVCGQMLVQF